MTRLQEALDGVELDTTQLEAMMASVGNQEGWNEMLTKHPNITGLLIAISMARSAEDEPERPEFKSFIKLLQILALDFLDSKYMESRIGWFMWWLACYARYDSYYPMGWKMSYDPLNWYHWDEPTRPDDLYLVDKTDPMNIKGECYIHPEWYRGKTNE